MGADIYFFGKHLAIQADGFYTFFYFMRYNIKFIKHLFYAMGNFHL
jgi:hypothetical protein